MNEKITAERLREMIAEAAYAPQRIWEVGDEDTVPRAIICRLGRLAWPGGPTAESVLSIRCTIDDGDFAVVNKATDATHIANMDPPTSLSILRELLEAREKLERHEKTIKDVRSFVRRAHRQGRSTVKIKSILMLLEEGAE